MVEGLVITISAMAGLMIMAIAFRPIFKTKDNFLKCLRYCSKPNSLSRAQGKYLEDKRHEVLVGFWLFLGLVSGVGAYVGLMSLLG